MSTYDGGYDETGFQTNRTYINYSPNEFVDPYSGNLILVHQDINLPGNGGLDLEINRVYNSKQIHLSTTGQWLQFIFGSHGINWEFLLARIKLWNIADFPTAVLTMEDGSLFNIYENNHSNINQNTSAEYVADNFAVLDYDETNNIWNMKLPDGTEYIFDQQYANELGQDENYFPTLIRDTNGNEINIEYYDCCNIHLDENNKIVGTLDSCPTDINVFRKSKHIKTITDSVGRVINFNWINNSCRSEIEENVVSTIDVNGKLYNYVYDEVFDTETGQKNFVLREANPPVGTGWKYAYESDGQFPELELQTLIYPSGGTVTYGYQTIMHNLAELISYFWTHAPTQTRVLTSRSTSGPGITPGTWTFSYGFPNNLDRTVVTDACGNKVAYKFHGARPDNYIGNWAIMMVDDKEILDPLDNVVELEDNVWNQYQLYTNLNLVDEGYFYPLLSSRTITRDSNTYTTNFTYNTFYASPTQISETGELTRTTDITYFEYLAGGSYIIDKPQSTTVTVGTETKNITNSYDNKGNLTSDNEFGAITDFAYHPDGNLHWEKNARNFYTHFEDYQYGVAGTTKFGSSNESATDPTYIESRSINWEGTVSSFTNGRDFTTTFTYDDSNRLTSDLPPYNRSMF